VIRAHLNPGFEPLLITPPFPEYPSGHSTQSGAAAEVLTDLFGEDFAFTDRTHEDDGLPARSFPSFRAAAEEAALSRLYGGIHFRSAIEQGLAQGRCIGAHAVALRTRP
jgi:membrane-associated phospholipid phosphatase